MTSSSSSSSAAGRRKSLAWALGMLMVPAAVQAQFGHVPTPLAMGELHSSNAQTDQEYRRDAARRIYDAFPMHVFRGRMPAYMHAVAVTETDIAADGQVLEVRLTREPAAAKEVGPWVVALIRRVGRFPPLARMEQVTYTDIWLVDKSGKFQLDTLSEGQHGQ